MDLTAQQSAALDAAHKWLDAKNEQVFRLFGYAGTGKTTIARLFAEGVKGRVLFGAFTGKAAHVLQQRGCPDAKTLHQLIYKYTPKSRAEYKKLENELFELQLRKEQNPDGLTPLEQKRGAEILEQMKKHATALKQPGFSLNPVSEVKGAGLVVIDEVSMVGERMGADLLSFGAPVLVLGDPAQLPPVAEGGYFTRDNPHALLTEIHRQVADSPIIKLATNIRGGGSLLVGRWGDSEVMRKGTLQPEYVARNFDQVIVGTNKTRRTANAMIRKELGFTSTLPEPGDKLICLRNNHEEGLMNGSQWKVQECVEQGADTVELCLEDEDGRSIVCDAWRHPFEGRELKFWEHGEAEEFDFGYAITCHKAQGSQWPRVLIIDESYVFRADWRRWLYTALTRAQESVTVVV